MIDIEQEYNKRNLEMPPIEKMKRSMALLQMTREALARQIISEKGPMSEKRLKLEVALRMYVGEPVEELIKEQLKSVPA